MGVKVRTYSELMLLPTLDDRFAYLNLGGEVGETTFGSERGLNQSFYHSREWREIRHFVIARDYGFDMGLHDHPIKGSPAIHHMNPLTPEDIINGTDNLMNPEFLISVSHKTHNAIHFGDSSQLRRPYVPRGPNDHLDWHRDPGK